MARCTGKRCYSLRRMRRQHSLLMTAGAMPLYFWRRHHRIFAGASHCGGALYRIASPAAARNTYLYQVSSSMAAIGRHVLPHVTAGDAASLAQSGGTLYVACHGLLGL